MPALSPKAIRNLVRILIATLLGGIVAYLAWYFGQLPTTVPALFETEPVPHTSDAADDPCIWIHPTDPDLSLVLGTDKDGGIGVYDLSGQQLQYLECGRMNNIDIRYNFPLSDERVALIAATNRSSRQIDFFTIVPKTRKMKQIDSVSVELELYGCCLYFSAREQLHYCFVTSGTGKIQQWAIKSNRIGDISGTLVREISVASKVEGCVADDELGYLYVSEEREGVWKFFADPNINDDWRQLVCPVDRFGKIHPDAEGLTLYYRENGKGYLIVSSQGNDRFSVFRREGKNEYITSFAISGGTVDRVTHTDGIDVVNLPLGRRFPTGLFVAQDDRNDDGNQNFKLVRWGDIASALNNAVTVDTSYDPRQIGEPAE